MHYSQNWKLIVWIGFLYFFGEKEKPNLFPKQNPTQNIKFADLKFHIQQSMKISFSWLKEYINIQCSPERLAELLTASGLEVEGLHEVDLVQGGLKGLVVGEVVSCVKHPNADKLSLTEVNIGNDTPLQIVCGAPNVAKGQKVIVATVGTQLFPTNGESFEIKKGKIRGEVSEGMICAEDEIGLGESHAGIMVLKSDAKVGQAAAEYFNLKSDVVFEIGLTPNRADAVSHYGVARDVYALAQVHPEIANGKNTLPASKSTLPNTKCPIQVEIVNTDACKRYAGILIENVLVAESPDWLKNRLLAIGLSPINNLVDIGNYVMYELGQPLHMFDAEKISSKKIRIQTVSGGTPFVTLDEKERTLNENDLMICNADEPMCIAGVFGGLSSGVSTTTTSIFIESAYFSPIWVRKTAKRHALNTDASFRFERGIDPNITLYALQRAVDLVIEIAGGELNTGLIDVYPESIAHFEFSFSLKRLNQMAGFELPENSVEKILTALEIEVKEKNANDWTLRVPPFKVDVTREIDVIEEVLRIYGYDQIPLPGYIRMALSKKSDSDSENETNKAAAFLTSQGFYEGLSNAQSKASYANESVGMNPDFHVRMLNPLSNEYEVMRQTLLFDALKAVTYNQNRQEPNLQLFEFGKVYHNYNGKIGEQATLGLTVSGNKSGESWLEKPTKVDFYYLKGIVEALLCYLGINSSAVLMEEFDDKRFEFALRLRIQNRDCGVFGLVSSKLTKHFECRSDVFFAELNWENLALISSRSSVKYSGIPKFPKVRRDLALLIDKSVSFEALRKLAYQQEKKLLKEVNLFDVYDGKNLPEGKVSYAISFVFQDNSKTLTDVQIDSAMDKLIQNFSKNFGAELRA